MKLIALAQSGKAPKLGVLQQNTNVKPPKLSYPHGIQLSRSWAVPLSLSPSFTHITHHSFEYRVPIITSPQQTAWKDPFTGLSTSQGSRWDASCDGFNPTFSSTSPAKQSISRGGGQIQRTDESKSQKEEVVSSDDYFIVKNPLVLLICCSEYKEGWDNLEGVKTDHKMLYGLFHDFYGWTVDSIHQNVTAKAIEDFFDKNKAKIIMDKRPCQFLVSHAFIWHLEVENGPPKKRG